jgi:hypothetical protein
MPWETSLLCVVCLKRGADIGEKEPFAKAKRISSMRKKSGREGHLALNICH